MAGGLDVRGMAFSLAAHDVSPLAADELASVVLDARDRGCIFPGCDRPPSWCDVHHGQHWDAGGGTSVDNGALLCRRHHTFIHNQNWKVNVEHGRPVVHRDDGARFVVRRWEAA